MISYSNVGTLSPFLAWLFVLTTILIMSRVIWLTIGLFKEKDGVELSDTRPFKYSIVSGVLAIGLLYIMNDDLNLEIHNMEFTVDEIVETNNSNNHDYLIIPKEVGNIEPFKLVMSDKYKKYHDVKEGDKFLLKHDEYIKVNLKREIYLTNLRNLKKQE